MAGLKTMCAACTENNHQSLHFNFMFSFKYKPSHLTINNISGFHPVHAKFWYIKPHPTTKFKVVKAWHLSFWYDVIWIRHNSENTQLFILSSPELINECWNNVANLVYVYDHTGMGSSGKQLPVIYFNKEFDPGLVVSWLKFNDILPQPRWSSLVKYITEVQSSTYLLYV